MTGGGHTRELARRWGLVGFTVLLLLALVPLSSPQAVAEPDPFGEVAPVVVVMDTSGSMDTVDDLNERRIDVARSTMLGLVRDLGEGALYGLLTYPGGSRDAESGCTKGQVRTTLGILQAASASAQIRRLSPEGNTPTGPALRHAWKMLDEAGFNRGTVVLVTDGENNCGEPPCDVAKEIVRAGFDIRVYPVGFHLPSPDDDLACVAQTTGGEYVDVRDKEGLDKAVAKALPAELSLQPKVPPTISMRTGTYEDPSGTHTATVTVTNRGRLPANDVRLTMSLVDMVDSPILIARPIRYLGNLAVGEQRTVSFDFRPEQQAMNARWEFVVTAKNAATRSVSGTVDITSGLDVESAGPLLRGINNVVVMGDSYSAGEGSGVYNSDSPAECHRSGRNYTGWLYEDKSVNVACSGAVTRDLFYRQHSGDFMIQPQLRSLRNQVMGASPPDAVFLSIGGNDAKFADVIKSCILKIGGCAGRYEEFLELGQGIATDVWQAVRAVDGAANDEAAKTHRKGPEIPVVVLPYPRIIPEAGAGSSGCEWGMSQREINALNPYIDAINGAVKAAVAQLRNSGRPVYYASFIVDAFQPNHTICEGVNRSFANMDNWRALQQQYVYGSSPEVLHPNSRGYQAEARALIAWSHSAEAQPVTVRGGVTFDEGQIHDEPLVLQRPDPQQSCPILGCLSEPGGQIPLTGGGFAPGTQVVVRIKSTPHTLGTLTSGRDGGVSGVARLPATLTAGDHEVILLGNAPDGRLMAVKTPVRIWPIATAAWMVIGGVGALFLIIGGLGLLGTRRNRLNRPSLSRGRTG